LLCMHRKQWNSFLHIFFQHLARQSLKTPDTAPNCSVSVVNSHKYMGSTSLGFLWTTAGLHASQTSVITCSSCFLEFTQIHGFGKSSLALKHTAQHVPWQH
jgi:hypothetical protein